MDNPRQFVFPPRKKARNCTEKREKNDNKCFFWYKIIFRVASASHDKQKRVLATAAGTLFFVTFLDDWKIICNFAF